MKTKGALVLLSLMMMGCGMLKQTCSVTDITRPETVTLQKRSGQGNIYGFTIVGTGHIEGEAKMVLILNGQPYKTAHLSGDVKFRWGGDWYSDKAEIKYNPIFVTGGHLKLKYKFNDL